MPVNKISNISYSDRIDIFIKCSISYRDSLGTVQEKEVEIIIENKVDSSEGKEKLKKLTNQTTAEIKYITLPQTERYYFACSKEYNNRINPDVDYQIFAFLTPDRTKCDSDNFVLLSYQDLVDFVFGNFIKRDDISHEVKSLVCEYLHNLGNPYNKKNKGIIAMTNEERELLVRFFEHNKQLFEVTIKAMISQAEDDGDVAAAEDLKQHQLAWEKAELDAFIR